MYTKTVKNLEIVNYFDWIKRNNYSILSPKHRGYYAEFVFTKYCQKHGIIAMKINPNISIISQILTDFLKKIQIKELEKIDKLAINYFCVERNNGYFVVLKMGTSGITSHQRKDIERLEKNEIFMFRIFEDGEILIKNFNKKLKSTINPSDDQPV